MPAENNEPAAEQPESAAADETALRSAKTLLRKAIALRRDLRSAERRRADDEARLRVATHQLDSPLPTVVAAYLSSGSEPATLQLVAWFAALDIRVMLPVLTSGQEQPGRAREPGWAVYAGPDALRVGVLSILEPTTTRLPAGALAEAELIICPGLAANPAGQRLGRGGGWYDRALSHASDSAPVWVWLNDDEVLETIPTQSWDRSVSAIVTPTRFIACPVPERQHPKP